MNLEKRHNTVVLKAEQTAPSAAAPAAPGISQQSELLKKRARAKYFSFALAAELANLNSSLHSSYKRTLNCCSIITQTGQKLTSTYCGARWCVVCNRIRTAKLINKYEPHLAEMYQPHFITLTIPNIKGNAAEIAAAVGYMQTWCRKTFDRLRKQGIKFKGFRKIEVTYNYESNSFHPHLHILTDGTIDTVEFSDDRSIAKILKCWQNAGFGKKKFSELLELYNKGKISAGYFKGELLIQFWLQHWNEARRSAQDVRAANSATLKELFKYSTKVICKTKAGTRYIQQEKSYYTKTGEKKTVMKKVAAPAGQLIFLESLDAIYRALKNKRVLQPIGFNKAEQKHFAQITEGAIQDDLQAQEFKELENNSTAWEWYKNDWREIVTGECLSKWKPETTDQERLSAFVYDTS